VAGAVQTRPEREFAADGLDCDREGRVYFTDLTNDAIQRYIPAERRYETIVHDERLVWPDAVSLGPDRILYVTVSQLNRAPIFNGGTDLRDRGQTRRHMKMSATTRAQFLRSARGSGLDGLAAHGEHVVLHDAIHAGDTDGGEQPTDGGGNEADQ